ncbi:Os12g0633650 [Oryza sativa Japonica Group]|uniref:Os12g0633650 protein n=1 Tax=Oryza sativa subsp. japonica TaxID=39947 RepID=A0A0P0YD91_ORYSJ|nr:hypothetical protein EE612_061115 [Oryza sativa]BAT18235.1 Os12g0633650 [Oryza sativa Japonica Group]
MPKTANWESIQCWVRQLRSGFLEAFFSIRLIRATPLFLIAPDSLNFLQGYIFSVVELTIGRMKPVVNFIHSS